MAVGRQATDEAESLKRVEQLISLEEAGNANADLLRKGDVLLRVSVTLDSRGESKDSPEKGVVDQTTYFIRCQFDLDQKRFAQSLIYEQEVRQYNAAGEVTSERLSYSPMCQSRAVADLNRMTAIQYRPHHSNSDGVLRYDNPSELFQQVGLHNPPNFLEGNIETFGFERSRNKTSDHLRAGRARVTKIDAKGQEIVCQLRFDSVGSDEVDPETGVTWKSLGNRVEYVYDARTLNVLRTEAVHLSRYLIVKETPIITTRCKWKEMSGVFVPTEHRRNTRRTQFVENEMRNCACEVAARLHWYSVNEELQASVFDTSNLEDSTELLRLVMPDDAGGNWVLGGEEAEQKSDDRNKRDDGDTAKR